MHLAKGRKGLTNLSTIHQTLSITSEAGLTTRQIADNCGLSIYVTRNWLTKLNQAGLICCHLFDGKYLYWSIDL
ncbi:FaeA/PapI family transcriptional regulator [Citrobacter braakii]